MTAPAAARRHRMVVAREQYKFSCAHMTVFLDGTKERLHGHNYQVGAALELTDVSFAHMIAFAPIKEALGEICHAFRERVLLAEKNPYFELVSDDGAELEVRLCGKRYVMPREDALLLPIDNVAVEPLAAHLAEVLLAPPSVDLSGWDDRCSHGVPPLRPRPPRLQRHAREHESLGGHEPRRSATSRLRARLR